jgi:hypothetical protein
MSRFAWLGLTLLMATLPSTSTYELKSYGFGSGGAAANTTTYSLQGVSGELNGQPTSTTNDTGQPGFIQTEHANVPLITLDNGSGLYYNKLHLVIDTQSNPTDTNYIIEVSQNGLFTSGITYLQSDGTLNGTFNYALDVQSYTAWGGSGGSFIVGLNPGTTYYAKIAAVQGEFSESAFGPVTATGVTDPANATTANPTITFSLQTSSGPTPPYTVSFGTLATGAPPSTGAQTINTSISTNAASGGDVYIKGLNGGLHSASQSFTIASASADLSTANDGFGAQNTSVILTSGGPYTVVSPYNGTGDNVGIINSTARSLYTSTGPVTASGVLSLLAKASTTDVAAADYSETLTFTASANF